MATYRYPLFAREGMPYLGVAVALALGLHWYSWKLAILAWMACLWLVFVFRDPPRIIPSIPLAIVSPVDGKILRVTPVKDHHLERTALRISIRMRWFDVYSLRSPTEGKVVKTWFSRDAGKGRPSTSLWIQTDEKDDVVTTIAGGFWRWKPKCLTQSGERVGQGQRCGFMHFGSNVDVFLPDSSTADVEVGDLVISGESIVAHLRAGAQAAGD